MTYGTAVAGFAFFENIFEEEHVAIARCKPLSWYSSAAATQATAGLDANALGQAIGAAMNRAPGAKSLSLDKRAQHMGILGASGVLLGTAQNVQFLTHLMHCKQASIE